MAAQLAGRLESTVAQGYLDQWSPERKPQRTRSKACRCKSVSFQWSPPKLAWAPCKHGTKNGEITKSQYRVMLISGQRVIGNKFSTLSASNCITSRPAHDMLGV